MAFARTLYLTGAHGLRARIKPITPCFADEYAKRPGASVIPAMEETRTMDLEKLSGLLESPAFDALLGDDVVGLHIINASAMRQKEMTLVRLMSMAFLVGAGS